MKHIKVYHNPKCSKSRDAIKLLDEHELKYDTVLYMDGKLSVDEIKKLLTLLKISPRELIRTKEKIYKELDLKNEIDSDDKLIAAMAKYPNLIERPIVVVNNKKAVLGRPTEKILEIVT